jgi:hypothetical protein
MIPRPLRRDGERLVRKVTISGWDFFRICLLDVQAGISASDPAMADFRGHRVRLC